MAWLDAVPRKYDEKAKAYKDGSPRRGRFTRRPPAPGALAYLFEIFGDIGYSKSDGNALDWPDISAWYGVSGLRLEYWELKLLIEMSWSYVSWYNKATNPKCPMPDWVVKNI